MEESNPLSFEVPVVEMPKWLLGAFRILFLAIRDELMHQTLFNSATQTYPMTIDLLHLWILAVEKKMLARLILSPKWTSSVCHARRS
jgi:hypothetical protein